MKKIIRLSIIVLCLCIGLTALTGCGVKFDADKAVSIVAREDGSGTKTAFMEIIGLKGKADPADAVIATGTAAVLATVISNGQAIAYESLGYVNKDVKVLKIDGIECTVANIKAGTYKIARPLSIVYKEANVVNGINKNFYDFLMSKDAQKIINDEGYVSLYDSALDYVKPAGLSGTINISGSTSLKPLMEILAEKFESYHNGVTVNVGGGGSGQGYTDANSGISHFGMISEEFSQSKATDCTHSVVAKDGIAVIVNKANTFNNLTMAQLKNIYNKESDSKYLKWSDING